MGPSYKGQIACTSTTEEIDILNKKLQSHDPTRKRVYHK